MTSLPDFVGVGPGRSGTTWLYQVLYQHSQVCTAQNVKETQFFDVNYERGTDWYRQFFQHREAGQVAGEISNRYIFDPRVADRIARVLPGAQIFIFAREPLDRLASVYIFKRRAGQRYTSIVDMLEREPELMDEFRYGALVRPFVERFPPEQLFVLKYSGLNDDPDGSLQAVCDFLGVDPARVPREVYGQRINAGRAPRSSALARAARAGGDGLRRLGLYGLHHRLKYAGPVQRALYVGDDRIRAREVTPYLALARETLYAHIAEDLESYREQISGCQSNASDVSW